MKLDVCIPAYNEADIIEESLARVRTVLENQAYVSWRIVVVDNGSDDGTGDVVESLTHPNIVVIRLKEKGKGRAIRSAAQVSEADFFAYLDADLSAAPEDVIPMLTHLIEKKSDLVIGSRLLDETLVNRGWIRTLSSRLFNLLRRILLGVDVSDSQCGIKVMNAKARELLRLCREDGWFLDLELLAHVESSGLLLYERAIRWEEYRYLARKAKLRVIRDGIGALFAFVRVRNRVKKLHKKEGTPPGVRTPGGASDSQDAMRR